MPSSTHQHPDPRPTPSPPPPKGKKRRNRRFLRRQPGLSHNDPPRGNDRSVVNLSDVALTEDQVKLLQYGKKFCPTPKNLTHNGFMQTRRKDAEGFTLRLKELFFKPDIPQAPEPPNSTSPLATPLRQAETRPSMLIVQLSSTVWKTTR